MRVGLDIGGTKTQALVVDEQGAVLAECTLPSAGGATATVRTAVAAVRRAVAAAGRADGRGTGMDAVTGVGVGIPGQVDPARGWVGHSLNLGVHDLPLADLLAAELGTTVTVDNDVKATALGAALVLGPTVGERPDTVTYVNLGTGVAAATVVGGRLLRGPDNLAGEIGHIVYEPTGDPCACGQRGCLETVAGGLALQRRLQAPHGPGSVAALFDTTDGDDAAEAAERRRLTRAVSWALTLVTTTYGAGRVVLGGGVLRHAPGLLDAVLEDLHAEKERSPYLDTLDVPGRLVVLPHDQPVGAIGAALLAIDPGAPSTVSDPNLVPGASRWSV